ncbi:MAG: sulfite exporter TauE/SafE family protein [Sphingomonadaceae bacterium]
MDPSLLILVVAGLWAGAQNALAGGGSFVTLPALMLAGLDARAANITSTVALFAGQITSGLANRHMVEGTAALSFRGLVVLSFCGSILGAALLLLTPAPTFAAMLPWLVLAATGLFALGAFGPKPKPGRMPGWASAGTQFAIGIYGGYFGGGMGFVMLATLTLAGMAIRAANATKNVLTAVMNTVAALVFAFSGVVAWWQALVLGSAAMIGGWFGARAIRVVPERALKLFVVTVGLALFAGLLLRG